MVVRPSDWHLLVLFNDPEHRAKASDLSAENLDKNGHAWISNVTGSDGESFGPDVYWRDYGTIKDQAGLLIGFNVTEEQVKSAGKENILEYLKSIAPNGLTGENNTPGGISSEGKIVTYRPEGADDVEFYAFDYDILEWYYLGKIQDSGMRDARLFNESTGTGPQKKEVVDTITVNGLLFSSVDMTITNNDIPKYWSSKYQGTW